MTKVAEPAPPVIRLTVYDSSRCRRLAWVEKEKIRFSFKGVKRVDALRERIHRS